MSEQDSYPAKNMSENWVARKIVGWNLPPNSSERQQRSSHYQEIADQLRERPGEWAQLDDRSSTSGAYQFALGVRKGNPAAFRPAGAFQGRSADCSVWVRYLGAVPAEDHEPEPEPQEPIVPLDLEDIRPEPSEAFKF